MITTNLWKFHVPAIVCMLLLTFFGTAGCESGTQDGRMVELKDGKVQGEKSGDAMLFLKIPYAKPPIGELRWKAPVPNDPWSPEIRYETEFSDSCPQLADQGAPASNNEDCLYLNVWAPEPPSQNAPVMVWIHGGGNFSGGANIPIPIISSQLWYDGQYFASNNGVVLVTFNYRLGPFGFFAHPELADEGQSVGNQGLLDQRLVLQWVKNNIKKFGGDPDNVTIFGESAGAADVCYHVASPGSRGLFHRAISQSGGCTARSIGPEEEVGIAGPKMLACGKAVGCDEGVGQLECMRNVSVDILLENSNQPSPGDGDTNFVEGEWSFAVVLGGPDAFLPGTPRSLFESGNIAQVPYLLGANTDEGTTFVWQAESLTSDEEYQADLAARFGDYADEVYTMYPPDDFDSDYDLARENVITDSGLLCSTHDTARLASDAGLDVFMYNFNVPWSLLPVILKAGHASEISHVFGKPYVGLFESTTTIEESQQVADAMNTYWAAFALNGNPNWSGAPALWPSFFPDNDKRLQLDQNWEILEDYRAEKCAFWRMYYGVE